MYDYEEFDIEGQTFRYSLREDEGLGAPWEECDGHGPVRLSRFINSSWHGWIVHKLPGERPMYDDGDTVWLYDWQAACKMARQDGWNAGPFDAPNRIERAVQRDFDRLRQWLKGYWCWVYVLVERHCPSCDGWEVVNSVGGIESDSPSSYFEEVAHEIASESLVTA